MRSPSLFISSGNPLFDRRFEWADGLIGRGEPQAAADLLAETVARAPEFIAAWFLLASAREQTGDRAPVALPIPPTEPGVRASIHPAEPAAVPTLS